MSGKLRARPLGAELGESKSGKPQVTIPFEIVGGDHERRNGHTITAWLYFASEKQEARTIESLRICGWRGDDLTDLRTVGGPTAPVVELVTEDEEYPVGSGKFTEKVKWINALVQTKPISTTAAQALQDRLRAKGLIGGSSAPSGGGSSAPAGFDAPGPSEDDVPF